MSVTKVGRYELRSMLARTPTSTVFEGWDALIARKVAVKIMPVLDRDDPETREILMRFSRGAQAAGMLIHPCIVAVHDYGETDDSAYLVMEFVEGATLKAVLDRSDRMPLQGVRSVIADVLAGLAYSHQHGVVHRDIKPANIMILPSGRAKIMDFGVARIEHNNITQTGTIIGTPAYMSPEQFRGDPVDPRTDIYSTGVVLYQMLTGHRPFEGGVATIAHKVLTTEPPPPSQVVPGLAGAFDPIVRRAMAKDRNARYPSAEQFASALDGAVAAASERGAARGAAAMPPAPRRADRLAVSRPGDARSPRGNAGLPVMAGVGMALAAGAVFWFTRSAPPARSPPSPPAVPSVATAATATEQQPTGTPEVGPSKAEPTPTSSGRSVDSPGKVRIGGIPPPAPGVPTPVVPPIGAGPVGARPEVQEPSGPAPARQAPSVDRTSSPQPRPPPRPVNPNVIASLAVPPPDLPPEIKKPAPADRPRVLIFYPRSSRAALGQTTNVAQHLLFSDFQFADTRSSSNGPHQSEIRFFHAEDRPAAERLAALLGDVAGGFRVQDWTERGASQPPGVLEVWLGE